MPARKIDFFIESSNDLRDLKAQVHRLVEAEQVYQTVVPDGLGQLSKVSYLRTGTLCLNADNGAVAAKLKQMLPNLLEGFRKRGLEITAIRIEVQLRKEAEKRSTSATKEASLSPAALTELKQLSHKLESGDLKVALTKMLARHGLADEESLDNKYGANDQSND